MDVEEDSSELEEIEKALESLTLSNSDASNAIGILANASRSNETTRQRLAEPTVLKRLIEIVECSINDTLETAELALKCIGNACIDNEEAKVVITHHGFSWAQQCLPTNSHETTHTPNDSAIGILTAKVLYNICIDYEPAQQKCFNERIHYALMQLYLAKEVVQSDNSPLFIELLFWICSHLEPDHVDLPPHVPLLLFKLPGLYSGELKAEDWALLLETCLLFLREPSVKLALIQLKMAQDVWGMLEHNEERLKDSTLGEDDMRLLRPLSTGLIWILSDVAALPDFAVAYSLNDDFIRDEVIPTIFRIQQNDPPADRLVDAACQILGNRLWSNSESLQYDTAQPLVKPLSTILSSSNDAELLHSAAGLLIQLARVSTELRELIGGDESTQAMVSRLYQHDMPQLKQDGIALLRALGRDSPANQERFANLAKTLMSSPLSSDVAMVEI